MNSLKKKLEFVQKRYLIAVMGFLAVSTSYSMRVCLSVAIVAMVRDDKQKNVTEEQGAHYCPAGTVQEGGVNAGGVFDWSEATQGIILSSFFWGYAATHLPGGRLADKYGGKHLIGFGLLLTAVLTLLTPIVAELGGANWLIAVRVLEGLGEGVMFPALNTIMAKWIPPAEKGRLGSLVFSGAQVGTVIGTALSGPLIHYWSWPSVFYVFGIFGILWFVLWNLICFSDPMCHPYISDQEKKYLEAELLSSDDKKDRPTPWRAILTSIPVWGLIAGQVGHDWGFYTLVTDLPKYMKDILHFTITQNAGLSAVPYLVMWISAILTGWIADFILARSILSTTAVRKIFTTIGSLGPAAFILGASYAGCDQVSVVVLFTVAMGLMGAFYPGVRVNVLDLSPNHAGSLMAIINGAGAITGIITPYLIGEITTNHSLYEWRIVFYISMAVFVITNVFYVFMASGEEQPWNKEAENNEDAEKGFETEKSDSDIKKIPLT